MTPAEYQRKWKREAAKMFIRAVRSGQDVREAAEQAHRRYHRALPVEAMVASGEWLLKTLRRAKKAAANPWEPQWQGDGYGVGRV